MKLRLESFDAPPPAPAAGEPEVADEARLAAWEQGYAAGWDDAVAAAAQDASRMSADLARHLQELGFTYHEARSHVLRGLEPLILALLDRVLPAAARAGLGALVAETLRPLAAELALPAVRVTLHPATRPAVEPFLLMEPSLPVEIVEDAALGPAEVLLALGGAESRLDLEATLAALASAVTDFLASERETPHG